MVKSVNRVFHLFELFERLRRPLRVVEIANLINTPQSSLSMLLKTLVARGYLDYDVQSRTFFPTIRLAVLCDWLVNEHVMSQSRDNADLLHDRGSCRAPTGR